MMRMKAVTTMNKTSEEEENCWKQDSQGQEQSMHFQVFQVSASSAISKEFIDDSDETSE